MPIAFAMTITGRDLCRERDPAFDLHNRQD